MRRLLALAVAPAVALSLVLVGCREGTDSPSDHPEAIPHDEDTPGGDSSTAPLDLVYVCGNRFLATNSTSMQVHVSYRVVGTEESGTLTLDPGYQGDPGYSETELETRQRGVVELYHGGERVARRSNGMAPCGPAASLAVTAKATTAEAGSWSEPFPWPIVALELALLPTGKVLGWGLDGNPQVWDPATGKFTEVQEPAELFCAGLTFLADGRLIAAGGHIANDFGIPNISIFDPFSESWSSSVKMSRGRWYPNATLLANGDVVITAGTDENAKQVAIPEVWSQGTLKRLTGASKILPYYPRAFLAPNGKMFIAGESQATFYLNPSGSGSWQSAGNRLYGKRDYGAAVMYRPGKILYVGGGRTTNTAEIINLNASTPKWQWTGSMSVPRRHLNATLLPTGDVLVTGGTSGTVFNDWQNAVHTAELWNPENQPQTWTTLASNTVSRVYHATSILLPDGRVLHTGSGDNASGAPDELSGELFSPPYLFQGPRPAITSTTSSVGYGGAMTIQTADAASITTVSLIRLGATTHAFDTDQRFQWLSFTRGVGVLKLTAPSNRNITPPGYYMLFILNGNRVPSVGKIIRIS
jgi:hypothetical protein